MSTFSRVRDEILKFNTHFQKNILTHRDVLRQLFSQYLNNQISYFLQQKQILKNKYFLKGYKRKFHVAEKCKKWMSAGGLEPTSTWTFFCNSSKNNYFSKFVFVMENMRFGCWNIVKITVWAGLLWVRIFF